MSKKALGMAVVLAALGLAATAPAQEAPRLERPELLFKLNQSLPQVDSQSITRDDLRRMPPPRVDKLPDGVTVTVVVGDPQCLPGEDMLPPVGRRPFRGSRTR